MYKKVKRGNNPYTVKRRDSFKKKVKEIFWSNKNSYYKMDYAQKREYLSPRNKKKKVSTKKKIEIVLLAIFVVLFFGLVAFHPFFSIKEVKVSGLNRISEQEFKDDVFNILSCKKLFVFSCQSYIFVDVAELNDVLFGKYSLNSIYVKKIFPDTLEINLEEKISTVIYDNSKTYSFVDLAGQYVETIANVGSDEWFVYENAPSSTEAVQDKYHEPNSKRIYSEVGDYPLIYDSREERPEGDVLLKPEYVAGIIDWYNFFNKELGKSIDYFTLLNSIGDASIKTDEGWEAIIRLGERFGPQSDQLKYILEKEINGQLFNYIELRYPDRAYWK